MISEEGLGDFYARRDWKTAGIPEQLRADEGKEAIIGDRAPDTLLPFIRGEGNIKEADLIVDGIHCASCIWLIERFLERKKGIVSARVNFGTQRAAVRWDARTITLSGIICRMRSIGYLAQPYTPAAQDESLDRQGRDLLIRLGTALFFSMQLMLLSFGLYAGFFQGIERDAKRFLEFGALLVSTPVIFYSGRPFLAGALRGIMRGSLGMDTLISLGALSAYALSVHHMYSGGEVYFDTAAMIITLVLLGRLVENSARRSASRAVSRLLALQPRQARVIRGAERVITSVSDVSRGDVIEVMPGEKIPLDGIVVEGESEADEAFVTGESRPVLKTQGSGTFGGSLNGLGKLIIRVTRIGEETLLAGIARLVADAQAASAPVQRLADRVSAWFIPIVMLVAAFTFFYRLQRTDDLSAAVMNAVSVLVIACPCALGLATPVAVLAATGMAAGKGVLFKGGDVLERMHRVSTMILDKTGTVTTGKMTVAEARGAGHVPSGRSVSDGADAVLDKYDRSEVLLYAASAEQGSGHLAGKAILNYCMGQGIFPLPASGSRAVPGMGVKAFVNGERILVGNRALLDAEGVQAQSEINDIAGEMERKGRTVVHVSKGDSVLGIIALADAPKHDAARAVERIRALGIEVLMITGDNERAARAAAVETGIVTVLAGAMPEAKAGAVAGARAGGGVVAMVGDGINDAPALAAADVGIAMATGSDIAIESSEVVLTRPDVMGVAEAVEISRRAFGIIRQNLFWAFFYNIAAIPLAVTGVLTPIVAAAAMAASSVTVVMNSMRLR